MFYPGLRALNLAENATHNLHNTYPIRGAQVRDANAWAKYHRRGAGPLRPRRRRGLRPAPLAGVGHARGWRTFSRKQRDLYKYLHDQTVRLMNHGYRAAEIAERLALPRSLARTWHVRGYYGTLSHNAKAVYQRYLGWYDANPANLNPLPPVARARKYVEYMGGAAAALARAREDFARGEYRFVAEAMSHLVFADPDNLAARALGADALEQLGYQAESATWRNAYLLGALELRQGRPNPAARAPVSPDIVRAMSLDLFFDYLAVRLDADRAEGKSLTVNWVLPDTGERYALTLEHGALTYRAGRPAPTPTPPSPSTAPRSTASSFVRSPSPTRWRRGWSWWMATRPGSPSSSASSTTSRSCSRWWSHGRRTADRRDGAHPVASPDRAALSLRRALAGSRLVRADRLPRPPGRPLDHAVMAASAERRGG